jgi:hypothetical protein
MIGTLMKKLCQHGKSQRLCVSALNQTRNFLSPFFLGKLKSVRFAPFARAKIFTNLVPPSSGLSHQLHQHGAGAKGGSNFKPSAGREEA